MKKIFLIFLGMSLLFAGAQAAVNVRLDQTAFLLEEDGRVLSAPNTFQDIIDLGGGLYAANQNGNYALMNSVGALLTQPVYQELRLQGGLLMARRGNAWGLLRSDGSICGAFEYSVIVPTGWGGAWALRGDPYDTRSDRLFVLDGQGREIETSLFVRSLGQPGDSGLLPVLLSASGWWGYCNTRGSVTISDEYTYAGPFISGRAVVVQNGRYGVIDAQGLEIADPDYDFIQISSQGFMIAARSGEGAWALDLSGREIASYPGENISVALVGSGYTVADGEALFLYDAKGTQLAQLPPDASVSEGMDGAFIVSTGMWGESCVYLLGTQTYYQNLYPLGISNGEAVYACLEVDAARYVNDLLGEIQLSVDMDTARYGIVDARGNLCVPCGYDSIEYLCDDRFLTRNDNLWQMIDLHGQVYWEFTQTEAPNS